MSLGLNTGIKGNRRSGEVTEGVASRYFPLASDNEWVYGFSTRDGERLQRVRVEEIRHMRGNEWAVLSYRVDGTSEEYFKLLRTEGDLLLQYSIPRTEQIQLIDFGRNFVDRTDPALGFIEEEEQTVHLDNMTFERCVVVRSGSVDHEIGLYAPGIGLIESSWLYGRKTLRGARIDGVELSP